MKKLPIIFTSAALIFSSIAAFSNKQMKSAHAAETTVSWSASSFTTKTVPSTKTGTIMTGDYEWTFTRSSTVFSGLQSPYWQLGSKSGAETVTFETDNILGVIKEVSINCGSNNGSYTASIQVGSTSYVSNKATASWPSTSTITGTGTSSGKITITLTPGSKAVYIGSISVKFDDEGHGSTYDSCSVTGGEILGSFKGTAYADCSASVTGTNNPSQSVNWSVTKTDTYSATSNATTATIDANGRVTFLDNGQVYVWATSKNDSSCHNDFGYSFNPTTLVDASFSKATSLDDLYDGQTIVISNTSGTKVLGNSQANNNRPAVDSTLVSEKLLPTGDFEPIILGIEELENGDVVYTFNTNDGYLYGVDGSNYLRSGSIGNTARWVISFTDGKPVVKNYAYSSRELKFNESASVFSCYTTGQQAISIYCDPNVTTLQKAQTFVTRFMKPVSVPVTDSGTGKCISESWYLNAKTAFNALTLEVRTYVANNFADAFVRLSTWADKNGDQMNDYTIVSGSKINSFVGNSNTIYILLSSFASLTFVGLAFVLKKRKNA